MIRKNKELNAAYDVKTKCFSCGKKEIHLYRRWTDGIEWFYCLNCNKEFICSIYDRVEYEVINNE